MQKIIYVCDKCGAEIDGDALVVGLFNPQVGRIEPECSTYDDEHLCPECSAKFSQWMHEDELSEVAEQAAEEADSETPAAEETIAGTDTEPAEDPCDEVVDALSAATESAASEVPAKHNSTKKLNLDEGKIRALYEGGWSTPKIADEFGVAYGTIANRLRKMGLAK